MPPWIRFVGLAHPMELNWIEIWGIWRPREHLELFAGCSSLLSWCIILLKEATVIREHYCHEADLSSCNPYNTKLNIVVACVLITVPLLTFKHAFIPARFFSPYCSVFNENRNAKAHTPNNGGSHGLMVRESDS